MTILYYEAKGETLTKLMEMLQARKRAVNALDKWAKTHGGRIATSDNRWGFHCVLQCPTKKERNGTTHESEPKDAAAWKRVKNGSNQWTPRLSTKRGNELAGEMRKLSDQVKGVSHIADYLKVPFEAGTYSPTGGFYIASIGLYPRKKRLAVAINCRKYKPPKNIDLVRISDLDFEKLTGEKL